MEKTADYFLNNWNIVAFPKLGLEFNIAPTAFTVFGFEIKWYGIIIAVGMLLAIFYCFGRMKEFGIDEDRAIDVVLVGLVAAMAGARLYFIMFDEGTTIKDFFAIRDGGLAIYGGIIAAFVVGAIMAKIRKVKLLPFFDIASMGFLIGQGIGRWGNFINKEAFGSATTLPWGMASASIEQNLGGFGSELVLAHPCFLYESIWCLVGFVLLHLYSKHRKFDGEMFLLYAAWYGLGRAFIEGLRTDSLMLGTLRFSQVFAIACVIFAVILLIIGHGKVRRAGVGAVLYRDSDESKQLLLEAEERQEKSREKRDARKAKATQVKTEIAKTEDAEIAEKTEEKSDDGKDN